MAMRLQSSHIKHQLNGTEEIYWVVMLRNGTEQKKKTVSLNYWLKLMFIP